MTRPRPAAARQYRQTRYALDVRLDGELVGCLGFYAQRNRLNVLKAARAHGEAILAAGEAAGVDLAGDYPLNAKGMVIGGRLAILWGPCEQIREQETR